MGDGRASTRITWSEMSGNVISLTLAQANVQQLTALLARKTELLSKRTTRQ